MLTRQRRARPRPGKMGANPNDARAGHSDDLENIERVGANVTTAIVVSVGGGIMWVIRTLLTNRRMIEMMQAEMRHRDQLRQEDRRTISDQLSALSGSITRIEGKLMDNGK